MRSAPFISMAEAESESELAGAEAEVPAEVEEQAPQRRLLLFEVAGSLYACDMAAVREIVPFQRITRLPGAPPAVCGLMNLRGSIVTVLDLSVRIAGRTCDREGGLILLVPYRDKIIGIGVDEVRDLQSIRADGVNEEAELTAFDSSIVLGLAEVEGELAVILDINEIVRAAFGHARQGEES
jgi:purine-binding chemotaxis protein CheW